jgi:ABC-type transport system involved in cytochrome bd biosynthesis fused ATPase/permease subunit
LVSGGQGQKVRLGRALLRPNVQLVILDEPFGGLEQQERNELLVRARQLWRDTTLLCVTHDLTATKGFDKLLVLREGRLVEEGSPGDLLRQPSSVYGAMIRKEALRDYLGSKAQRRFWLESGRLSGLVQRATR